MEENYKNLSEEIEKSELPWLIFTLNENAYAVNSKYVNGLEMYPEKITPMPDAPDIYCGLVERRGEVYPLLNMRKVFKFASIDDEAVKFKDMMEQRCEDHINWVNTLEKCVHSGEPFPLATDPHKCALGVWYDGFITNSHSAGLHLKKIEEPHRLLHESASAILSAAHSGHMDEADKLLQKVRENYCPKIISVLKEAENVYRSTYREIVVVLSDEEQKLGLLVDEVLAVDKIELVNGSDRINLLLQSKYFEGTARNDKINIEILIVNENELFKLSDVNVPKR